MLTQKTRIALMESFTYISPIGLLQFDCSEGYINQIHFVEHETNTDHFDPVLKEQIEEQFDDYFAGRLQQFQLPLRPHGTDFQQKVWKQLELIDYGTQTSYSELAISLGDKNLVRAVGGANSKNPLPIVIPCHRVVGANNKLVGYAGGLWRKKWLLRHEMEFRSIPGRLF